MDFGTIPPTNDNNANSSWQMISADNNNGAINANETNTNTTETITDEENINNANGQFVNVVVETQNNKNIVSNVSGDQIVTKYAEYELLENQLAKLEEQGLNEKRSMANDEKQLKRQMKQAVKNKNEDDTDTDEYKDISSTTASDPTAAALGSTTVLYRNKNELAWYKTKTAQIIAGIVGIGFMSFVIYKFYFTKPSSKYTIKWLQNTNVRR